MAAALLVGTNAWADVLHATQQSGDEAKVKINDGAWQYATHLKDAFDAVEMDQTAEIVLLDNVILTKQVLGNDYGITMPHTIVKNDMTTKAGPIITLNMNGKRIDTGTGLSNDSITIFRIVKGSLNITGSGVIHKPGAIGAGEATWGGSAAIAISGTNDKTATNWSTLTVGENVTIHVESKYIKPFKTKAIAIVNAAGMGSLLNRNDVLYSLVGPDDMKGKYGYYTRADKNTKSQLSTEELGCMVDPESNKAIWGAAYGVKVTIAGTVIGPMYGVHVHGNINARPGCVGDAALKRDTVNYQNAPYHQYNYPYINITSTAHIESSDTLGSTGIYSSGYAVIDIRGEVVGATGIYMKGGDIQLTDANIWSNCTQVGENAGGNSGIGNAGGSAISIETSDYYPGQSGVTIQGDTKVTGGAGYAIFDKTTAADGNSTVSHITVEGGTIEGGSEGGIKITEGTVDVTTVAGGNVTATVTVSHGDDPDEVVTVNNFIPEGTHTTTVQDGDKTIVVVSKGAAPTEYDHVYGNAKDSVKWIGTGADATETLADNLTLKELEINQSYAQVLTIPSTKTLTVGHLIMGENAQIIVEPGAKFIVNGDQGIVAPKTSNIILKTNETTPAEFLFKPSVSSNRHPNATVQLIANSYTSATNPSADYRYQRFGVPTHTALKGLTAKNPSTNTDVQMFVRKYENNGWLTIGYINVPGQSFNYSKMNDPFGYYILQCNVPEVGTLVSMSGELVGNVDASLTTGLNSNGWSTFTNSYSAKLNMLAMMDMFAGLNVASSAAIYFQTNLTGSDNTLTWGVFNLATIHFDDVPTELNPMQAFLIKDPNVTVQSMNLNYNTMVWKPATGSEAPQRAISNLTKMAVKVYDDANIQRDAVYMLQADQFSEDMDQGYDAVKYMNENINLYVMNDERLVTMATDNLAGHYLGFSCEKGGIYTLSFEQLAGDLFTLVDLENNATMDINEGFSYQFEVASNTTDDYRFLIVERQNAPTDLDSVNETVVKENGIYTVTGQYMGNMSVWNTLPAGLYIVNGEKKVK